MFDKLLEQIAKNDQHLKEISFSHKQLRRNQIEKLGNCIVKNTHLKAIDLSYCELNDKLLNHLIDKIKKSSIPMVKLLTDGNPKVSEQGKFAIIKLIATKIQSIRCQNFCGLSLLAVRKYIERSASTKKKKLFCL